MKTLLLSANLGEFDKPQEHCLQDLPGLNMKMFGDDNFPPRSRSMSPRLQARIPKMFGWDLCPDFDYYIWLDASFRLRDGKAARYLTREVDYADFAFYAHPKRHSIREEAEHIQNRIEAGSRYLTDRYKDEDLEGQLRAISQDGYVDDCLYATMVFAYRPTPRVKNLLTEWWVHTSRFHSVDQLALPYLLWEHGCSVSVLKGDPYNSPWIEYTRGFRA
jgi:hypothetical protein